VARLLKPSIGASAASLTKLTGTGEGIYIQMNYNGPGAIIAPLERAMRLSDEVIRYLTVKQEFEGDLPEEEVEEAATVTAGAGEEE
jgi:small subunit ribosomal protein S6